MVEKGSRKAGSAGGSGAGASNVAGTAGGKAHARHSLSKIPEVIDPGITVPIYEEDIVGDQGGTDVDGQPQKLGSYRARAGRFSNTLSNLLPSISAKLHHNRKGGTGKVAPSAADADAGAGSTVVAGEMAGSITPPQDLHNVVSFPEPYGLAQPRTSSESYTYGSGYSGHLQPTVSNPATRTRNNTVSSQITSLSSMGQLGTPSTSNIWTNNGSGPADPISNMLTTQFNPIPLPDFGQSNYYDVITQQQPPQSTNSLNVPSGGNIFWEKRTRSQSNASSIYADALFDTSGMQQAPPTRSRASTFASTTAHQNMLNTPVMSAPLSAGPIVQDEVDPRSLNWVSTDPTVPPINQISHLLPSNTISISNIFPLQQQQPHFSNAVNLTSTSLATLCLNFGKVLSARTLKTVNMAIVEFETVDAAMRAKDALNGKEVSLVGAPSAVFFAKVLPMHQQASTLPPIQTNPNGPQSLLQEQLFSGAVTFHQQNGISIPVFNASGAGSQHHLASQQSQSQSHVTKHPNLTHSFTSLSHTPSEKEHCPFPMPPADIKDQVSLLIDIIRSFGVEHDQDQVQHIVSDAIAYNGTSDTADFGPLPEPLPHREFDAPKLRELRKLMDTDNVSDLEIEQLAVAMLDELPELSSDYLGNTIVQKLFENSSTIIKDIMLRQTSKYLTSMGVHKNGTWACQKMTTMADTPRQMDLVAKGVYKYCTPLFNDQFGNYVIQCVLKFGFPWNNFIFESIVSNFCTIVQNRYGARAVRACLEAHDIITQEQLLVLSAMILLYAEYLATNSNGALLVTWFLDTSSLPNRHSILTEKLLPHIVELCCDRLASLTILKILNFRSDEHAKRVILDTIFGALDSDSGPPQTLYQLLSDTNYGSTFVYKILSTPLLEGEIRNHVIQQVRHVLMEHSGPQHRRLMEEVGFANSSTTGSSGNNSSASSKHRPAVSHVYATDSSGHMRTVSVSSNRSSGSVPRTLTSSQSHSAATSQQSPGSSSTVCGYNYPGTFPTNSGSFSMAADDLATQFDILNINNNAQMPLPQISMNQVNTNTNGYTTHNGTFGY
ncbi:AGL305Wp [Eremothecium gossypii ATCC 10895]|uniref:AGL305Wp n=1 Tax=Eremothecium gossypii (strain ATCC 10895 / CBS 109.51 / FGSC 9923 / NRRL Y-1056) TaxID=284811 RepID=Q751K6_EREGS|nr:AGL305Wp [Eremothecium gossypii ATCC 10895]AAS54186.2 AGL305Wp [Eremothecium gossypii ATCC 10895]AEY98512.1 FAGL305Wp [Eremothecium gossypii FDAG1]